MKDAIVRDGRARGRTAAECLDKAVTMPQMHRARGEAGRLFTAQLAAHALFYVSFPIRGILEVDAAHYLTFVGLLAFGSVGWLIWYGRARRVGLFAVATALYIWLAIRGILRGNWLTFWGADAIFFTQIFGIGIGLVKSGFKRTMAVYVRLFIWFLPVAAIGMLVGIQPSLPGHERLVGSLSSFTVLSVVMPSLYLALADEWLGTWEKRAVMVGLALVVLFGVFTQTRGAVLWPVVILSFRFFLFPRKRVWSSSFKFIIAAAGVFAIAAAIWSSRAVDVSSEGLTARWEQPNLSSGRDEEGEWVLGHLSNTELVTGRGFGGSYQPSPKMFRGLSSPHGRFMVHFVRVHLMMKGGWILLALLSVIVLLAGLHGWQSHEYSDRVALGVLALFVMLNFAHEQFTGSVMTPLAFVAVGQLLRSEDHGYSTQS